MRKGSTHGDDTGHDDWDCALHHLVGADDRHGRDAHARLGRAVAAADKSVVSAISLANQHARASSCYWAGAATTGQAVSTHLAPIATQHHDDASATTSGQARQRPKRGRSHVKTMADVQPCAQSIVSDTNECTSRSATYERGEEWCVDGAGFRRHFALKAVENESVNRLRGMAQRRARRVRDCGADKPDERRACGSDSESTEFLSLNSS